MKKLFPLFFYIVLFASAGVAYVHFTAPKISDIPQMKGTVLVEVYEEKCPWYKRAEVEVKKMLSQHKVKMLKVEGSKEQAFTRLYNAKASPTWLVFKDGKLVGKSMGFMNATKLWEKIKNPNIEEEPKRIPRPDPYLKITELERRVHNLEVLNDRRASVADSSTSR